MTRPRILIDARGKPRGSVRDGMILEIKRKTPAALLQAPIP